MPALTVAAKRHDKTQEHGRNYGLHIGSGDYTSNLLSATVTYANDGSSDLALTVDASLETLVNAPVSLRLGYGSETALYFAGDLEDPVDTHWGDGSTADAWGPFKLMVDQMVGEPGETIDYRGWTLEGAFLDLVNRAGYRRQAIDIRGASGFVIGQTPVDPTAPTTSTAGLYNFETTIQSVAQDLVTSAGFVLPDRPGGRLLMPKPRPGATGKYKASYDEGNYGPKAFTASLQKRGYYSRVVIFRRETDGSFSFPPVDVPVSVEGPYKPPRNRAYLVSDFVGSYQDAVHQGDFLARTLSHGSYACSISSMSANPDLLLYDSIEATGTEFRGARKDRYRTRYGWIIDGGITATVAPGVMDMSLTGTGIKLSEKSLPKPFYLGDNGSSPYVLRSSDFPRILVAGLQPDTMLQPDTNLQPDREHYEYA